MRVKEEEGGRGERVVWLLSSPSFFVCRLFVCFFIVFRPKSTMEAKFLRAARKGTVEKVKEIVRNDPSFNVNCLDAEDKTALSA